MIACPNCGSDDVSDDGRCHDCGFNQKSMRAIKTILRNIGIVCLIFFMAVFTAFIMPFLWLYGLREKQKQKL